MKPIPLISPEQPYESERGGSEAWARVAGAAVAALCFFGCVREVAQMSRPEKIVDATHVQTRDGKIHTVLESHEP